MPFLDIFWVWARRVGGRKVGRAAGKEEIESIYGEYKIEALRKFAIQKSYGKYTRFFKKF